ncbi:MAG: prolyl oligopeptidase family serine peptidase [Pirellulales bacterium]|nr:prolyl oligopeptidase family serine peptidase [Pirellulales bacterium]
MPSSERLDTALLDELAVAPDVGSMLVLKLLLVMVLIGAIARQSVAEEPRTEANATQPDAAAAGAAIEYPAARRGDQADDYHGTRIADPYRWLEDPDSEETRAWVEAENKLTSAYLGKIPARDRLRTRLTELWDYEKVGVPVQRGGRYLFAKNDGLQNQSVLYVSTGLDAQGHLAKPRLLLDPNTLSTDGTVALSGYALSDDGRLLAYGLSSAGSDWQEWKVRDVDTGADRDDLLKWVKFSGAAWSADNAGFFYSRYDEPKEGTEFVGSNYFQKLYYHKLGTPQSDDVLVYERPDQKEWGFGGEVSEDGRYLVISVSHGTERKNDVFYKDLTDPQAKVVELLSAFDAQYVFLGNEGTTFWFLTDSGAPRYRVIAIALDQPQREHWRELVAEADAVLQSVSVVGDRFIADYLRDAHSQVRVFDLAGKAVRDIELPGLGSAGGFTGRRRDNETFYSFTSYTTPGTIYRYEIEPARTALVHQPKLLFDPADYETRQVFYTSRDGTRVPMFISAKRGLKQDGRNPTLLFGYGGFNISLTPSFSVSSLVWMEMGGIYAVPNLRGGGEYGREWHEAGTRDKKQNVFDDFIAAAEYLVRERYTSTDRLAISGRSNGGLLVGACLTQRPDLFGATLPGVGVLDMLRFHKFTIGWAWVSDYGSSDEPEDFRALVAYSPLHNIKPGTNYPPTLITTADHDDRVVPGHSFKFAAALQAAQQGPNPILIRIDVRAGHGAGKPTAKLIDEAADTLGFLTKALRIGANP